MNKPFILFEFYLNFYILYLYSSVKIMHSDYQAVWFYLWESQQGVQTSCMNQIFTFTQLKLSYFLTFLFLFVLESFLSFHGSHPSDFLVDFNPRFLESFNSLLQFLSNPHILSCELNNSCQSIFSFYSQLAQFVVEVIQFRVIRNVSKRNFNLVSIIFIIDWYQTTILPFLFHFFKNLYQIFQFFLEFFGRISNQTWQLVKFTLRFEYFSRFIVGTCHSLPLSNQNLFPLNFIVDPFSCSFRINFFLLLIKNRHDFFLCICQILVSLIGAVQIELTHLMSFKRNFKFIDYLNELVHAQKILGYFMFVKSNEKKIMNILLFII